MCEHDERVGNYHRALTSVTACGCSDKGQGWYTDRDRITIGDLVVTCAPDSRVCQVVYVSSDKKVVIVRRIGSKVPAGLLTYTLDEIALLRHGNLTTPEQTVIMLRFVVHETSGLLNPDGSFNPDGANHFEIDNYDQCAFTDPVKEFKFVWAFLATYILEKGKEVDFSTLPFDVCSFVFQYAYEVRLSEEQIAALQCTFLHSMRDPPADPIQLKKSFLECNDPQQHVTRDLNDVRDDRIHSRLTDEASFLEAISPQHSKKRKM